MGYATLTTSFTSFLKKKRSENPAGRPAISRSRLLRSTVWVSEKMFLDLHTIRSLSRIVAVRGERERERDREGDREGGREREEREREGEEREERERERERENI